MALPRRTGRSRLTLALLILTSLAVLTLDFRDSGIVEGARRVAGTVFSPLRGVADTISEPFSNGWNGITDYGDLKEENERLRERLEEMEGQRVLEHTASEELDALSDELGIPWIGDIQGIRARVVSGPVSNFAHTVELSKGTEDGIREGMPVVSAAGLVGKVVQATASRSVVQLLSDPDFAVGVRLLPEGVPGTARGAGEGDPLVVDTGLDGDTDLEPGGELVTSGADRSTFPAQIPVGTVRGTKPAGGGLTLDLIVEPFVDTSRLTFVTVLLWEPPP
ncbi:MAG TPA: rod shape-determining protein MreC [Acidimicrobiales bacterium]|nr:rod shape-determining protein MreC [Acidimicrobiales bacterium]